MKFLRLLVRRWERVGGGAGLGLLAEADVESMFGGRGGTVLECGGWGFKRLGFCRLRIGESEAWSLDGDGGDVVMGLGIRRNTEVCIVWANCDVLGVETEAEEVLYEWLRIRGMFYRDAPYLRDQIKDSHGCISLFLIFRNLIGWTGMRMPCEMLRLAYAWYRVGW
ncbi:hypothetical protein B0J11DRAFT_524928 [Dendryphion nanum]|uniref:Uncharacterized protein n=1 Tax=Dendryphion nanum TaxID=256645 RepID=A0A9P9E0B6_9PLEO|nr:hypothetical protein B0J11DRAFT_524928 [Dendryphion nanum]